MSTTPSGDDHGEPMHEMKKCVPAEPPLFFFEVLARGAREILIDHKSQIYRLRVTKNGKLILNK